MVVKGKWVVGMLTIGDVRCGEEYVAGFPRNGKSFTVRLERFLAANEQWVNNIPDLLQGLIGQWSRHGLKESTISVYLKLTEQYPDPLAQSLPISAPTSYISSKWLVRALRRPTSDRRRGPAFEPFATLHLKRQSFTEPPST